MRILSVDFDYFVDTTIEMRQLHFPDGNDSLAPLMNKFIWDRCYDFCESIKHIGVIPEYYKMCDFLKSLKNVEGVLFADSHREIERFFTPASFDEETELINVDFHHDMYITGGDSLDCGNWLRFFKDYIPEADITWVRREDSDIESLDGEFPYKHTTDFSVIKGDFDLVFLCFSSPWSPPHLKPYFDEMCRCVEHFKYLD